MEPLVLVGGGGHCLSVIEVLRSLGKFQIVGILDNPEKVGTYLSGFKIIGTDEDIPLFADRYHNFLITVGQIKSAAPRIKIYNAIKECGGICPVIVSPGAYVSTTAFLDEGTIIMNRAIVNINSKIGKACIVNTGALIEHEAIIGDFSHVSTYTTVNGQVIVGSNSFLGSNSVIANNITLPEGIIVAAGSCIIKNPRTTGIFVGNPARKV